MTIINDAARRHAVSFFFFFFFFLSFFSLFPFFSRDGNYAKNLLDAHLWICGF
jgi:hypothetical protein